MRVLTHILSCLLFLASCSSSIHPSQLAGGSGLITGAYLCEEGLCVRTGQYSNVEYCGKTVSLTAAHLAALTDTPPLFIDETLDIVIFPILDPSAKITPSHVLAVAPSPISIGDTVYISTIFRNRLMVFQGFVAGRAGEDLYIQTVGFYGGSGSPILNEQGQLVGFFSGMTLDDQLGLLLVVGVDHSTIVAALEEVTCK